MSKNKFTQGALVTAVVGAAAAATVTISYLRQPEEMPSQSAGTQEKCFGVAKAGENDCAAADGSHGCHTKATVDGSGQDYKLVPKGTCVTMNGQLKPFGETAKPEPKEG